MMETRQNNYANSCRILNNNSNGNGNNNGVTTAPSCPLPKPPLPRKELLNKINCYSFAVNEANLFLDTHPYDANALAYFQKYRKLRLEAVEEYAKFYAPLIIDYAVDDKTPWSWVNEPWPWEGVEC